jgi:hypothetical protein
VQRTTLHPQSSKTISVAIPDCSTVEGQLPAG